MIRMPGNSWSGPLPPLTECELTLSEELRRSVTIVSRKIGERNVTHRYEALRQSAHYIDTALSEIGYGVKRQPYEVLGRICENLEVELPGADRGSEIVIVGAHYDSVVGSPGANDNGSGIAAALSLARMFNGRTPDRTLRFVFFVNEEMPFFQTENMGSLVYSRRCRERGENVVAMLSLETIGFFSDGKGTQKYPPPLGLFYPSTGNFIAFVGNMGSRNLVKAAVDSFRRNARFPSEGGAFPGFVPGIFWSDHWAFWQSAYPAIMVTDTAPFRYHHYHLASDTLDKIDFDRLARVVAGLERVVADLAEVRP